MKKILSYFSFIVIFLFVLSVFGWVVFHTVKGDKKFGVFTQPVKFLYTFPDLFSQSVEEVKTLPKTFVKTPVGFKSINHLEKDLVVLTTFSDTSDTRSAALINLKNDSLIYRWKIKNPYKNHNRIKNPLLFPQKDLVYSFGDKSLIRIDSLSNVIWKQDSIWGHHSLNIASDGNIWACTYEPVYYATGYYKINGATIYYKDNYITKLDAETGQILFHKSITEIFVENDMANYILKSDHISDPIHLNDIEPALKTTSFYQKGDLFISLRQPSLIFQYRPSTNRVIRKIEGPFVSQHDVDFLGDSSLLLFNNNFYTVDLMKGMKKPKKKDRLTFAGEFTSNILRYDFASGNITTIGDSLFKTNNIFSFTESLQEEIAPDTYFVEEQNTGLLWVIEKDRVIYKNVLHSPHIGYHHLPNWTRIISYHD